MKKIISISLILSMLLSLFGFANVYSSNVLITENFESGLIWDMTGGGSNAETVKVSDETASEGKASLLLIDDTDSTTAGIQSPKIAIEGGKTYTLVADILNAEGASIKAYLRYSSPSNSKALNKSVGTATIGKWERIALTETAAEDVTHAQIFVMGTSGGKAKAFVDNIRLVEGEVKSEAITPSVEYKGMTQGGSKVEEASKPQKNDFPEWTKIEGLGDLQTAEIKKSDYTATNGLSGYKVRFGNMSIGKATMNTFTTMNNGIAANGNDMSKYPQKAELIDENGEKVIYMDSPASGSAIAMYLPDIVFDDVYSKDLNYKFRFKAKRGTGDVIGEDDFNVYVRYYDGASQRAGQTAAYFIEKSQDYIQYEIVVPSTSIPANAARITGLFNAASTEGFRDLYIKDIEVYVKDNSKPMLVFDMPQYIPPEGMHPRVYFNKNDIERIKADATHPQNQSAYERLLLDIADKGDGKNKGTGDNLNDITMGIIQSKAFYYAVWGDESIGREAVSMMKNFLETANYAGSEYNSQGFLVFTIGAVYDWCYPLLNDDDKVYLQDMGVKVAASMEIGYPPEIGSVIYGHSAEAQLMRDQFAFALAVSDERKDIYQNIAGRFFADVVDARKFLNEGESSPFGPSYITYRFQWEMLATYMLGALGFEKPFGEGQEEVLLNFLYTRRGDGQYLRDGDHTANNYVEGTYDTRGTRAFFLAGNYWKNPYLKGEAMRQNPGLKVSSVTGNQSLGPVEFLCFNDPNVGYKSMKDLPLSTYLPAPKGGMIARTGWADGYDSPAVVAEMSIDEYWTQGHQHLDAGEFEIYYKGALATDTGYYQAGRNGDKAKNEGNTVYGTVHFHNYQRRTIAHNCMTVFDPNEPLSNYNGYANDGGQLYHGGEKLRLSMREYMAGEEELHVAKVLGHEFGEDLIQPDYTYLKGDLQKAYGDKVPEYERSFMFLNLKNTEHPAALIVFDRVVSKDKSFEKKWILHGLEKPEVSGSRTIFKDTRNNYNGTLTVDTILPSSDNLKINTVGGEGQEYLVNGVNYWAEILPKRLNEGGGYRIEVSPKAESEEDLFLNVLQVSDTDKNLTPLVSEKIDSETHVGVKISDRVVLFGKGRDRVKDTVSFNISSEGWYKITVADLKEGKWQVTKDGTPLTQIVSTQDGGVGSFEGAMGSYSLTYLGEGGEKIFTKTPLPHSDGINIKVNNIHIYCDVEPTIINSRTMVPLRAIFEALNSKVTWDEATKTATGISSDGLTTVQITNGSNIGIVNGKEVYLDSPAVILNGRFLVPARFVSESLGALVSWDDYSKTVGIVSNAPGSLGNASSDADFEGAVKVLNVTESSNNGAGDVIENSIDGNLGTAWSVNGSDGEAWGIYELLEEAEIKKVIAAFKKGSERKYTFSIAVSLDGINYENIITNAQSSGKSEEYETFDVTTVKKAKYVKFIGGGSDANSWNNIYEIVFSK